MSGMQLPPPPQQIEYSRSTYELEKQIAAHHIKGTDGLLPTGDELGGHFWDWVESKWRYAIDTGHEARFQHYHPCVYHWLERDWELRNPVFPQTPTELPIIQCPVPVPCPCPGPGPGPPSSGTVPEPATVKMFAIGLVIAFLARRWKSA